MCETPQQNNIVEHKHQHILNVARALIFQSQLPLFYWSYVVKHSVHLINRTPTPLLQDKSSYQIVYNYIPDLSHIKNFDCLAFATTSSVQRTKFSYRAKNVFFSVTKMG